MNPSSINNWVKEGRLTAFRTPGGHRRIRAGDLVNFLGSHDMPIPQSLAGAARRRLLWVQEDKRSLRAVERHLERYEAFVDAVFVDNAVHALVQFGLTRPHVFVIDEGTTKNDVYDLCKRLRSLPDAVPHDLFVVMDDVTDALERKAKGVGAAGVLSKPVSIDVVLGALQVE